MTPERTCVGCRRRAPQGELVRYSVDPESQMITPTEGRTRSGRGAYVHPDEKCLALALKRGALPRALRTPKAEVVLSTASVVA